MLIELAVIAIASALLGYGLGVYRTRAQDAAAIAAASPAAHSLSYSDVGHPNRQLSLRTKSTIRAIEADAAAVRSSLAGTVGDERLYVANATLERYLPQMLERYYSVADASGRDAPATVAAAALFERELSALRDALADVRTSVVGDLTNASATNVGFLRARFEEFGATPPPA